MNGQKQEKEENNNSLAEKEKTHQVCVACRSSMASVSTDMTYRTRTSSKHGAEAT